jgi:hypothetical protein
VRRLRVLPSRDAEALWRRITKDKEPIYGLLVTEVAGQIKGPRRTCGKSNWRVDVLWPNPDSEGVRRRGLGSEAVT